MPRWKKVTGGALAAALAFSPPPPADTGFARFVKQQTEAAKAAARQKDWVAAETAWSAVLGLDPLSDEALAGLAGAAQGRVDDDAELFARREQLAGLRPAMLAGDKEAQKSAAKVEQRIAALDPAPGEIDALLAAYSDAQSDLGEAYGKDGFYANALAAWQRRLALCVPGSAEETAAANAIRALQERGGDEIAVAGLDAAVLSGGKSEAWILEHDKKTSKISSAARLETPHYRIKTNAGWRLLNGAAAVMERVHAFYREVWGIVPDPEPDPKPEGLREISITPIDVEIYGTHKEFLQRSSAPDWAGGLFDGSAVYTFDQSTSTAENRKGLSYRDTFGVLFHEASHQFMHVAVGGVPSFVNEGVASLFEGIEILSNGSIRRDLPVTHYLSPLAKDIRDGKALRLHEVMNGRKGEENEAGFYQYRWGVMYFLRMYVDVQGSYVFRDRLTEYIYAMKAGPGDVAAHFAGFFLGDGRLPGVETLEDFEKLWRQWILDLEDALRAEDKRLDEYRDAGRAAALRNEHEQAARFYDKALDIDPEDVEAVWGAAAAAEDLDKADRAVLLLRRFVALAVDGDKRVAEAARKLAVLDPHDADVLAARQAFVGGMAGLAQRYDRESRPRMALWCGQQVLDLEPYDKSARALVTRLTRDKGVSVDRWRTLFNGFDKDGWYGEGLEAFTAQDEELVCVFAPPPVPEGTPAPEGAEALYRTIFVDESIDGDWSLQARVQTQPGWSIVGLCFGVKDGDHFEAIVLRNRREPGVNNVDFGSFDGGWDFRGDGSVKASYDPTKGVLVRVDVRGRDVSVSIDGQPVQPILGKQALDALRYPSGALRGDVGLLASEGTTRFSEVRLLRR